MHPLIPRISILSVAIAAVSILINSIVPEPYLDEVFHIPQAQAYCDGQFSVWDPKLTTPAGLYLLSYPLSYLPPPPHCSPALLRGVNAVGVAVVLPLLTYRILRLVHPGVSRSSAAHSAVNVALFPLLFFFAGLYYTDVYSTVFVLASYLFWLQGRTWWSAAASWAALWFRQTNVLWAVFLAVLEGVRALELAQGPEKPDEPAAAVEPVADQEPVVKKEAATTPTVTPVASPGGGKRKKRKGRPSAQAPTPPMLSRVNSRLAEEETQPQVQVQVSEEAQQDGPWTINVQSASARSSELSQAWSRVLEMATEIRIWNPPFTAAVTAQDLLFSTPASVLLAALQHPSALLLATLPYLCVLLSFAAFIVWNDLSIVLGDKSAHQPTLHIPQLYYFATFTLLTSWPLLASPQLLRDFWAENIALYVRLPRRQRSKRPRKLPPGFAANAAGNNNKPVSISLPTLLRTTAVLAVILATVHTNTYLHPYLLADNRHFIFYVFRRSILLHPCVRYLLAPAYLGALWAVLDALRRSGTVTVVWLAGWCGAVAGTLVGAGLVEARYFVVGWVLWRCHVGVEAAGAGRWRRWAETLGFVAVDAGVLWVFLRWGFEWESERGKVQRFMW